MLSLVLNHSSTAVSILGIEMVNAQSMLPFHSVTRCPLDNSKTLLQSMLKLQSYSMLFMTKIWKQVTNLKFHTDTAMLDLVKHL